MGIRTKTSSPKDPLIIRLLDLVREVSGGR
jgi:hypothetical protein